MTHSIVSWHDKLQLQVRWIRQVQHCGARRDRNWARAEYYTATDSKQYSLGLDQSKELWEAVVVENQGVK